MPFKNNSWFFLSDCGHLQEEWTIWWVQWNVTFLFYFCSFIYYKANIWIAAILELTKTSISKYKHDVGPLTLSSTAMCRVQNTTMEVVFQKLDAFIVDWLFFNYTSHCIFSSYNINGSLLNYHKYRIAEYRKCQMIM